MSEMFRYISFFITEADLFVHGEKALLTVHTLFETVHLFCMFRFVRVKWFGNLLYIVLFIYMFLIDNHDHFFQMDIKNEQQKN